MNYFDLRKFLAEGGIKAKLKENFFEEELQNEGKDEDGPDYEDTDGANTYPFVTDKEEQMAREMHSMSDNNFIKLLNRAFSAADDIPLEDLDVEDLDEGKGRPAGSGRERGVNFKIFTGDRNEENILRLLKKFNELYISPKNPTRDPKAKKGRTPFSDKELQNLAKLFASGEPVTSKKIMDAIPRYKTSAPANTFLKVMDDMGRSGITSVDKKVKDLERRAQMASGKIPDGRGRKKKVEDEEGDTKKKDKEPTDNQIRNVAKKFNVEEGLSQNDIFLNNLLKKKPLTEIQSEEEDLKSEEEIANLLDNFYKEKIDFYPNVQTFADEVRTALDAIEMTYSDDADM